MPIDPYLPPCTKLKSKDLNIKQYTLNLAEEKVRKNCELIGTGEDFFNRPLLALALRSTVNKWNLMKLKSFCNAKDTIIWTK